MEELVKLLDKSLKYTGHKIIEDTIYISVISDRHEVKCPFCGVVSVKVHSRYIRDFKDLPIQGKKVVYLLTNRKMFCVNPECPRTTFAERFDFLGKKAKKSKRLEKEIINIAAHMSTVAAGEVLSRNHMKISASGVRNALKKNNDGM